MSKRKPTRRTAKPPAWDFPIRYRVCKKCHQGLTKERYLAGDHHCRLGTVPVSKE